MVLDRFVGFSSRFAVLVLDWFVGFSSRFAVDRLVGTIGGCFSSRFAVDRLVDTRVDYLPLRSGPAPSGGASSDQENEAATTGFVGAWAQYEQDMLRDVRANIQPNVRTQSMRVDSLGKSFKNYWRTVLYHLNMKREEKRAGAAQQTERFAQVWTDDDMQEFLTNSCTFEAQVKSRAALKVVREDPTHADHG